MLGRAVEMLVPERIRNGHFGVRNGYFAEPRIRAMGAGLSLYGLKKDGHEILSRLASVPCKPRTDCW